MTIMGKVVILKEFDRVVKVKKDLKWWLKLQIL